MSAQIWHGTLQQMPDDDETRVGCDVEFLNDAVRVTVAKGAQVDGESPSVFVERTKRGTEVYIHRDSGDPLLRVEIDDTGWVRVIDLRCNNDIVFQEQPAVTGR